MKKVCSFCSFVSVVLFFNSCLKDSGNHIIDVIYPDVCSELYADEQIDSLVFNTFDSYYLEPLTDWIEVTDGASYTVKYDNTRYYQFTSLLLLKQNTTGRTRTGEVKINSHYPSVGLYRQFGYMNIKHPSLQTCESSEHLLDSVSFDLFVDATATEDSICFKVSDSWTLDFAENADRTWTTIGKSQGSAGDSKVTLSLTPNTDSGNARTTILFLKCGEVTNQINITQLSVSQN